MAAVKQLAPTQKDSLGATINFRLKEDERGEVEKLAQEFGVSLSDAARMILRRGLRDKPKLAV